MPPCIALQDDFSTFIERNEASFSVRSEVRSSEVSSAADSNEAASQHVDGMGGSMQDGNQGFGITIVLQEESPLEDVYSLLQEGVVRDVGDAVEIHHSRMQFVGAEEGKDPGTVLVHINLLPSSTKSDRRTSVELAHLTGRQVEDANSRLRLLPCTRHALHIGLHPALKRADEGLPHHLPEQRQIPQQHLAPGHVGSMASAGTPDEDAVHSLQSFLAQVRSPRRQQRQDTALEKLRFACQIASL